MYSLLQKMSLLCNAEWSHDTAIKLLNKTQHNFLSSFYSQKMVNKPTNCFGIDFPNDIGLAAGLDKNAECIDAFASMGFGFIEVGTTTPRAQLGNEKPRMFRLPEYQAIINRMGFNNKGVDYLVQNVKKSNYSGVLGINIGKNKDTPDDQALDDYIYCMQKVYELASYITVNISSPNTPGLRNLQYGDALKNLLSGIKAEQCALQKAYSKYVPILVKIAPDLSAVEIEQIADVLVESGLDGVIATNTTLDRRKVASHKHANESGGLSGAVLNDKSLEVTQLLANHIKGRIPIVGVGGISSADDAIKRREAGASLLQIYSSFIYQGPALINELANA
ncbi:quinone-dependent dihydroorotate dehydrogenase [Glaciecola petra]|uniref:Dihydroorotate dehydrogenase (quinone) n=1 Tax=Glaciecola petra TaxID=3075602 RepID=A0ABU2ZPM5_9ALTE|nr:quinone-dependent dihydroorotate dehydrogenase [Aestuariibacter sp. P117]MDT0594221.1 quinone-dependent dihydroorotate dehydrogenase [Aestuariibacter sp. P117]